MKQHQSGFTLVELSIVLVIIGLIIGGILAGADMIKAAQIRKVISEYEEYKTAVFTFRNKYGGLPGDLKNATQFWGEKASAVTCHSIVPASGIKTCNGDGNGKINILSIDYANYEFLEFWRQLNNAKLIKGWFTGVFDGSVPPALITTGINVPESNAFKGVAWSVIDNPNSVPISTFIVVDSFFIPTARFLTLGKITGLVNGTAPAISPLDAYNIDNKIDDGKPAKGKVNAYNISTCTDAANAADVDADYLRDVADGELCSLGFINVF